MTLGMDGSNRGLIASSIIETKDELEEVFRSVLFLHLFYLEIYHQDYFFFLWEMEMGRRCSG